MAILLELIKIYFIFFIIILGGFFSITMVIDFFSNDYIFVVKEYLNFFKKNPFKIIVYSLLLLPSFIIATIIYLPFGFLKTVVIFE